jgi:hypothetical protein
MSDELKADAILAALPWRCFQCDFVTSDPEEALAHKEDRLFMLVFHRTYGYYCITYLF